jgi:hypothetical protein
MDCGQRRRACTRSFPHIFAETIYLFVFAHFRTQKPETALLEML